MRIPQWTRNPDWWVVILTGIQALVLSAVGYTLSYVSDDREIISLTAQLASQSSDLYQPAAYRLVQHGTRGIDHLISFANANEACLPWDRAVFFHDLILRSSPTEIEKTASIAMVWSAWKCNVPDLGKDVYLYEALKRSPEKGCPVVFASLPDGLGIFSDAALLAILDLSCHEKKPDALEKIRKHIEECARSPKLLCVEALYPTAWPKYSTALFPRGLADESWKSMLARMIDTLGGDNARGLAWQVIAVEPLWSKIVFGLLMSHASDPTYPADLKKFEAQQLNDWIDLALGSVDSDAKSAALRAIDYLGWKQYKVSVKRLALNDPNPDIRRLAAEVLDLQGQ